MEKEEIEAQIKHEVSKINDGFAQIEKIRKAAQQLGELTTDFSEDEINRVFRELEHLRKVPRRNCVPADPVSEVACKNIGVDNVQLDAYLQPKDYDPINHPSHYTIGIEVIDFIESWDMSYHLGNVLKYLCRAPHKGRQMEDLQKALWYLRRYVRFLTKRRQEAVKQE